MNRNGRATGNAGNLMGILLIVAGVVIAGNVMNWWNISLFFRGWWTLFIIIPCAGNVRRYGMRTGWGAGLIFTMAFVQPRLGNQACVAGSVNPLWSLCDRQRRTF